MPPSRLPPFAGLLAFEAVLRHGSMTLAGEELGLTQSAVSHRIRALELFFGVPLFERLNPGLRATAAASQLSGELGPPLGTLAGLRRRIAGPDGLQPFRLGVSAPLLAWWLSARLPAIQDTFPDLAIELVSWTTPAEATRVDADLVLLWRPVATPVESACELVFPREVVFPVAAPRLLKRAGFRDDWQSLPLLAKGRRDEETGPEWSWTTWLRRPGREVLRFRDINSSLQAAVDGNGVALARSLLAADAVKEGRLVRLRSTESEQACSKQQVARWRDPRDATAARLSAWFADSAERSVTSTLAAEPQR